MALDLRVGSLADGSCWYENKESVKIASFNDKSVFNANRAQLESDIEKLLGKTIDHVKPADLELFLHCGGYGSSLVAKVSKDGMNYCLWAKFEKGALALRSLGVIPLDRKNANELCDGHIPGEFILGNNSEELILDLQLAKWSGMIKSVSKVSEKTFKVSLTSEYFYREQEVIDQITENDFGKNFVRFIEFNDYQHPIGEFVRLK